MSVSYYTITFTAFLKPSRNFPLTCSSYFMKVCSIEAAEDDDGRPLGPLPDISGRSWKKDGESGGNIVCGDDDDWDSVES